MVFTRLSPAVEPFLPYPSPIRIGFSHGIFYAPWCACTVHTCMSESRLVLSLSLALPAPPQLPSGSVPSQPVCLPFAALPLHISASPCSRSLPCRLFCCDIRPKVPTPDSHCQRSVLIAHSLLLANTELTGVGPSGSRDPSRSSLSVSLFLFSSPFSMLCILVWTAPAGVYISRYSSRRQAP